MLGLNRAVFTRTLRRGHSGEDVRQLQLLLRSAGFDPSGADGVFGAKTEDAVKAFQRARGLVADGLAGPLTVAALTSAPANGGTPPGTVAKGLSLHIGLNRVDNAAYGFTVPDLAGCINDANDMLALARDRGFRTEQLLDNQATSARIVSLIEQAAQELLPGDLFWISYSGHGSQVPDPNESDQKSETWVLWDRQLIDDELYALWGKFQPGVRILVISDSCHSGTVTRQFNLLNSLAATSFRMLRDGATRGGADGSRQRVDSIIADAAPLFRLSPSRARNVDIVDRPRLLDETDAAEDVTNRAPLYREELARSANASAPVARVLLISGCQDNQTSSDGRPDPSGHQNGAFTKALRTTWESARDYADLHARILQHMPSTQSPNFFWATDRDAAFEAQRPFTI